MLERPLRYVAIVCSVFALVGWGWFAYTETSVASQTTAQEVAGEDATGVADPDAAGERAREKVNGRAHEVVDDVNDVLLKPFAAVSAGSDNPWVRRTVPMLLALVAYGFGLSLLARYAQGRLARGHG